MRLKQQTKNDLLHTCFGFSLFIAVLFMISLTVSKALSVSLESARHLVASVSMLLMLVYILRDLVSVFWRVFVGTSTFVLLVGAYGALSELYVMKFTVLGIGELPTAFSLIYLVATVCALGLTVYSVKNDLLGFSTRRVN